MVNNEATRLKFDLSKSIETKGMDVKPCIVVIKNKAYRISSWKEFFKIAYYNNIKSNKNLKRTKIAQDANALVISNR